MKNWRNYALVVCVVVLAMTLTQKARSVYSSPVNVTNPTLATLSADNPALQPFQNYQVVIPNASTTLLSSFSVPSGKTLVIEELSLECLTGSSTQPFDVRLLETGAGVGAQYSFVPTSLLNGFQFALAQVTRIYADSGTTVGVATGTTLPANSSCAVAVAGHLVSPI